MGALSRSCGIRWRESLRRLSGALLWALLLACLAPELSPAAACPQDVQAGSSAWWEVRLVVTAEGEYSVKGGPTPVAGTYACKASWEGRLEPDGEDFLLVHLKTEILEWRLRETSRPGRARERPRAPRRGQAGVPHELRAQGRAGGRVRLRDQRLSGALARVRGLGAAGAAPLVEPDGRASGAGATAISSVAARAGSSSPRPTSRGRGPSARFPGTGGRTGRSSRKAGSFP